MKIILSIGALLVCTFLLRAQSPSTQKVLYVSFHTPIPFVEDVTNHASSSSEAFKAIALRYNLTLKRPHNFSEAALNRLSEKSRLVSGADNAVAALRSLFRIDGVAQSDLENLAAELRLLESVRYCSLMSAEPIRPPFDIPPTTNDFFPLQNYIGANPGVNMQYAWDQGLFGQGINVRDIEYGVNVNHEDLNEQNTFVAPGMTINSGATEDYTEHGTAAIGVLYAEQSGYGATGMIHQANEVILFPEYTEENGYDRVAAIFEAIANSNLGDVIMYEMQAYGATGSGSDFVPAEYDEPVWDLTKAATDAGIVIVAAAGNGNQNLDDPIYADYLLRGHSGAIIVGAGSSNTSHNRLSFSSYGSRVDVQGWGQNVFSPGYGDAFTIGGDFDQQYTYFSGTSSATPIVTACAVNLQSHYHTLTGGYLHGNQIRDILFNTGIPQGGGTAGNIGPLPNMEDALIYLTASASVEDATLSDIAVYPNPATSELNIRQKSDDPIAVQLMDASGRIVASELLVNGTLNVANCDRGIYFLTLEINGEQSIRKIVLR